MHEVVHQSVAVRVFLFCAPCRSERASMLYLDFVDDVEVRVLALAMLGILGCTSVMMVCYACSSFGYGYRPREERRALRQWKA